MSRIPQPSSSRSPLKPPSTPGKSRIGETTTPTRSRTQPPRSGTPTKPPNLAKRAEPAHDPTSSTTLSLKEAIALKRAEAKKAAAKTGGGSLDSFVSLEDALPLVPDKQEDEDILGRGSVRETIERARSTGSVNLSARSLTCIPSGLFEIHLGITPDSLKSVPNEPQLPPPSDAPPRRGGRHDAPAWFEAQDLQTLKAWNNDIQEIQHEISLFGSLKLIDLHKNRITSLPNTFADLMSLNTLNLSHNSLASLPKELFALPELASFNISHNLLTSLPFNAPFADGHSRSNQSSGGFFTPMITRASTPLPHLVSLDASHNKITAGAIDLTLPISLTKIDLSGNPLGEAACQPLIQALGILPKLKELRFERAEIGDRAFPPSLFSSVPFPCLRLLDLGETRATLEAVKVAFKGLKQEVLYDMTTDDPPDGVALIIVGKKVVKEAWEIEVERRSKSRAGKILDSGEDQDIFLATSLTTPTSRTTAPSAKRAIHKSEVMKEAWEVEAEQGLLTEGGKRRARAAAAAEAELKSSLGMGMPTAPSGHRSTPSNSALSLTSPQYYSQASNTLTLPPSTPPSKAPGHGRAFSLAIPSSSSFSSSPPSDIAVPAPTLPLSIIMAQPYAQTLKVLVLINRRMDRSFALPLLSDGQEAILPNLEELNLEGCGLPDSVSISRSDTKSGASTPPRSSEPILSVLTKVFPSLQTLNLAYNALTSASLTTEALSALILSSPQRKGLRHLRLRGNRLVELDGFQGVAESFKGNRDVPSWKLEELDLRDNEVTKLLPELGLLPLDVFLVDGNPFRIPQRRVWEREGTKGLLSWLRGRIE